MNKKVPYAILIVGLCSLGLGIYSYIRPSNSQATLEAKTDPIKILTIPLFPHSSTKWDEYGPGEETAPPAHIYARAVGSISFTIAIPEAIKVSKDAELTARLSSELKMTKSNDKAFSSDITLLVNDNEYETKNVIPDNISGAIYTWKIPSSAFVGDKINTITFMVKPNASYKNGLAIYGPMELKF